MKKLFILLLLTGVAFGQINVMDVGKKISSQTLTVQLDSTDTDTAMFSFRSYRSTSPAENSITMKSDVFWNGDLLVKIEPDTAADGDNESDSLEIKIFALDEDGEFLSHATTYLDFTNYDTSAAQVVLNWAQGTSYNTWVQSWKPIMFGVGFLIKQYTNDSGDTTSVPITIIY